MTTRTTSTELTAKQRVILRFIAYRILRGNPPTVRDIGKRFGIKSTNGVNCHLEALVRKGYIEVSTMEARGIRLVGGTLRLHYDDSEDGRRLRAELEHDAGDEGPPPEGFP